MHSGPGGPGDYFEYTVTVPSGTVFARFDRDSIDDTAELDLTVYQLDAGGTPIVGWQSASGSADERVDIVNPDAADDLVYVDIYSGDPASAFDFRTYSVSAAGEPIGLSPAVLPGQQGIPLTYTASWSGLLAHSSYLGIINYGDTGAQTFLSVTTGEVVLPGIPVNTSPTSGRRMARTFLGPPLSGTGWHPPTRASNSLWW